jgi:hypothetical protein
MDAYFLLAQFRNVSLAQLFSQTRQEYQAAVSPGFNIHEGPTFKLKSTFCQSYLQASFVEVLHQRNHIFIARYANRGALQINKYFIPAKSTIIIPSTLLYIDGNL